MNFFEYYSNYVFQCLLQGDPFKLIDIAEKLLEEPDFDGGHNLEALNPQAQTSSTHNGLGS